MLSAGLDSKERLNQQKQLLNKRLGLDMAAGLGIASEDLFQEDDLIIQREASSSPSQVSALRVDLFFLIQSQQIFKPQFLFTVGVFK